MKSALFLSCILQNTKFLTHPHQLTGHGRGLAMVFNDLFIREPMSTDEYPLWLLILINFYFQVILTFIFAFHLTHLLWIFYIKLTLSISHTTGCTQVNGHTLGLILTFCHSGPQCPDKRCLFMWSLAHYVLTLLSLKLPLLVWEELITIYLIALAPIFST